MSEGNQLLEYTRYASASNATTEPSADSAGWRTPKSRSWPMSVPSTS
ncbi:hypothetical protein ACFQV2_27630 [Actinokineospora soli]|uniref:Uncharacterized protein n=1 Tax=Actinokineospora soli TaxID=1048753 RepID=A0ABW2TUQ5_9PSEU